MLSESVGKNLNTVSIESQHTIISCLIDRVWRCLLINFLNVMFVLTMMSFPSQSLVLALILLVFSVDGIFTFDRRE